MKSNKLLCEMFVMTIILAAMTNANTLYWAGPADGNWAASNTWKLEWGGVLYSPYTYEDNINTYLVNGSCILYSGNRTVADFTMFSNHGDIYINGSLASAATTDDVILTVKNGANLHSNSNFDLGYFEGDGTVILNVEPGAIVSSYGYFPGSRPGYNIVNLGGTISIYTLSLNAASHIDFGSDGCLFIVGGAAVEDIDTWVQAGNITDRGIAYGQAGWGTTYGIIATYNAAINRTIAISRGGMINAGDYGSFNDTSISAALIAIGAEYKTLYLASGTWQIYNSLTIPENVTLQFAQGAVMNVASNRTLTINGPINFDGSLGQIFSGSGDVICGQGIYEVYPQWWGATGTADDTVVCQSALDSGAAVVRFPAGTYNIDADGTGNQMAGLQPPSNISMLFEPGAKLRAIPTSSNEYSVISIVDKTNVSILGAAIEGDRAYYTDRGGEWGMGICVSGSSNNIYFSDVNAYDCWGDGIYIAGDANDITVENSIFNHNRRTGCAIICGRNLTFRNCVFSRTDGTSTYCGVRLEPNYDFEYLQNIIFEDCQSHDNITKGFSVACGGTGSLTTPISVSFVRCTSNDDGMGFNVEAGPIDNEGIVYITDCVVNNPKETGFTNFFDNVAIDINGLAITDPNQRNNANLRDACGMVIWIASGVTDIVAGNILARNVSVISTDGKMPYALGFNNEGGSGTGFDNIDISLTTNMPANKRLYQGTGPYTNFAIEFLLPFFDGFESGNFTSGGWTKQNNYSTISTAAKYSGTYGTKIAQTSWIQKMQTTEGFNNIHVKYNRRTYGLDAGEYLYVEWSTNGSTWNTLESTQQTSWAAKDFVCAVGANDNSDFRIRFRTNANSTTEYAYIDNIEISGDGF